MNDIVQDDAQIDLSAMYADTGAFGRERRSRQGNWNWILFFADPPLGNFPLTYLPISFHSGTIIFIVFAADNFSFQHPQQRKFERIKRYVTIEISMGHSYKYKLPCRMCEAHCACVGNVHWPCNRAQNCSISLHSLTLPLLSSSSSIVYKCAHSQNITLI